MADEHVVVYPMRVNQPVEMSIVEIGGPNDSWIWGIDGWGRLAYYRLERNAQGIQTSEAGWTLVQNDEKNHGLPVQAGDVAVDGKGNVVSLDVAEGAQNPVVMWPCPTGNPDDPITGFPLTLEGVVEPQAVAMRAGQTRFVGVPEQSAQVHVLAAEIKSFSQPNEISLQPLGGTQGFSDVFAPTGTAPDDVTSYAAAPDSGARTIFQYGSGKTAWSKLVAADSFAAVSDKVGWFIHAGRLYLYTNGDPASSAPRLTRDLAQVSAGSSGTVLAIDADGQLQHVALVTSELVRIHGPAGYLDVDQASSEADWSLNRSALWQQLTLEVLPDDAAGRSVKRVAFLDSVTGNALTAGVSEEGRLTLKIDESLTNQPDVFVWTEGTLNHRPVSSLVHEQTGLELTSMPNALVTTPPAYLADFGSMPGAQRLTIHPIAS